MKIILATFPAAGTKFYGGLMICDGWQAGNPVAIVHDPENSYDPQALELHHTGEGKLGTSVMFGHVPKPLNQAVGILMEHYLVKATISEENGNIVTITAELPEGTGGTEASGLKGRHTQAEEADQGLPSPLDYEIPF